MWLYLSWPVECRCCGIVDTVIEHTQRDAINTNMASLTLSRVTIRHVRNGDGLAMLAAEAELSISDSAFVNISGQHAVNFYRGQNLTITNTW